MSVHQAVICPSRHSIRTRFDSSLAPMHPQRCTPMRLRLAPARVHSKFIKTVVFHPGGEHLASGSSDKTVCLYELPTYDKSSSDADGKEAGALKLTKQCVRLACRAATDSSGSEGGANRYLACKATRKTKCGNACPLIACTGVVACSGFSSSRRSRR